MFKFSNKGFTTIELLVTVAIIGLLATFTIISIQESNAKARDARRLNDVQSLVKSLSIAAAENQNYAMQAPCDSAGALTRNCIGPLQPGTVGKDFPLFSDPIGTAPCTGASTEPCDYTIRNSNASVDTVQIMFFLESDAGSLDGGQVHWIDGDGIFDENP